MAEGLLRHDGGARFEVFSAGTQPSQVRAEAITVMRELGIDISAQHSKSVDEFTGQLFAHVITVCDHAREHCPVFPDATGRIHWSFADPAAATGDPQPASPSSAAYLTKSAPACANSAAHKLGWQNNRAAVYFSAPVCLTRARSLVIFSSSLRVVALPRHCAAISRTPVHGGRQSIKSNARKFFRRTARLKRLKVSYQRTPARLGERKQAAHSYRLAGIVL